MLRRVILGLVAIVVVGGGVLLAPSAAQADYVYCIPGTATCYTVITNPAPPPASNPDPQTGFSAGNPQCLYDKGGKYVVIPCTTGNKDYWSNGDQCYVSLAKGAAQAPPGGSPGGAWYDCEPYRGPLQCDPAAGDICRGLFGGTFWSDTPPPGINTLTPQQAAYRFAQSFKLRGIDIGFAPDPATPGSKSYVGVPIWMWVDNPQPLTYGPYSQTGTLGGITITATARVTSILWNMGDGHTVACGSAGTPFKVAYGAVASPTCGYRYAQVSTTLPSGRYTVTATSQWSVVWSGGGTGGTIPLTTTSTNSVRIQELEAVNVNPGEGTNQ